MQTNCCIQNLFQSNWIFDFCPLSDNLYAINLLRKLLSYNFKKWIFLLDELMIKWVYVYICVYLKMQQQACKKQKLVFDTKLCAIILIEEFGVQNLHFFVKFIFGCLREIFFTSFPLILHFNSKFVVSYCR